MSDDRVERLAAETRELSIPRRQTLFREGEQGSSMFIITEGRVKVGRALMSGPHSLMGLFGPGDLIGVLTVFDPGLRTATATAVTDVEVMEVTSTTMRRWVTREERGVAAALFRLMTQQVRRTNDAVANLLCPNVTTRLAGALHELTRRLGEPTSQGLHVHHGLTQVEIAQFVGASRESINKAFAELTRRGILELDHLGFLVLSIDELEEFGRR